MPQARPASATAVRGIARFRLAELDTLRSVTNNQHLVIRLDGVKDTLGVTLNNFNARVDVLLGDVTGNRTVTNGDVAAVQGQVGSNANQSVFRSDVNTNGLITNGDVAVVQGQVGSQLP